MKKISNLSCVGCGSKIQIEDPNALGYVKEEVVEKLDSNEIICHRCFQIKNYNKIERNDLDIQTYQNIFNKSVDKKALFIYLVDVFDFEGTYLPEINDILKDKDFIFVANKFDLLPQSLKENKLTSWLRSRLNKSGLKARDVFLTSVTKKKYIDEIVDMMDTYRRGRDVYIIGVSNVGKSTLINAILKSQQMTDKDTITTSIIPGTTIDLIEIPFFLDNNKIIDTPGIINEANILNHIDAKMFKLVMPKKEIKARNYQLDDQQSIIIGGFAAFDYQKGNKQTITFYFNNTLTLHRTKLEKSEEIFTARNEELFKLPNFELDSYEFKITSPKEIVILGLGFIRVDAGMYRIRVVKNTKVVIRDGFIG